jgi:hypothetical protein
VACGAGRMASCVGCLDGGVAKDVKLLVWRAPKGQDDAARRIVSKRQRRTTAAPPHQLLIQETRVLLRIRWVVVVVGEGRAEGIERR